MFSDMALDVMKEIANIGSSTAATSLSNLLGFEVKMNVPGCRLAPFESICDSLGGPSSIVTSVLVKMSGDLEGYIMLFFDMNSAFKLIEKAMNEDVSVDDVEGNIDYLLEKFEPINEIANILISSYIGAISQMTGFKIVPTVPSVVIDMALAVMNVPVMVYGELSDEIMIMDTKFNTPGIEGQFLIVPTLESFDNLMKALGI